MGSQLESGWVRQHAKIEVDDVEREEDGVERLEAESLFFGNFPEDFRVRMLALLESGGCSPCWCRGPLVGACR